MKKLLSVVLTLAMVLTMAVGMAETTLYTPGTYEAAAQGMGGDVKVTITVDAASITDVQVDVSHETPGYGADHQKDFEAAVLAGNGIEMLNDEEMTALL